jgi:hypothetical protein
MYKDCPCHECILKMICELPCDEFKSRVKESCKRLKENGVFEEPSM